MNRSRLTIAAAALALALLASACDTHDGEHCTSGYTTSRHTHCTHSSTSSHCTTTGGQYVCTHWTPDDPSTVKPESDDQ